jgi:hypothetical protein
MKEVNVTGYVHPEQWEAETAEASRTNRPKRDITYSVVLGYGFRPSVKPRDRDQNGAKEQH